MSKNMPTPLVIFYVYVREDEALRERLDVHLSLLRQAGVITSWYDRLITAGKDRAREIDKRLNEASIILLLVSPDFIASDYYRSAEMRRILERGEGGEARVIPILLRPCTWQDTSFGYLSALPTDGRPVELWRSRDQAFLDIADGIRRVIEELRGEADAGSSSVEETTREAEAGRRRTLEEAEPGELLLRYDVHADFVITVAWSPDGTRIASGGLDCIVHIWRPETGAHLLTYRSHPKILPSSGVYVVRWSPDGSKIASAGSTAKVQVWNPQDGQKIVAYEGHSLALPSIFHLEWSPDGSKIASTNMAAPFMDEAVHIWNAANGRRLFKIDLRRATFNASSPGGASWSPDGRLLAVSWEKKIRIYNASTGKYILTYEDHPDWINGVTWSPDGKYIASSSSGRINVWEPLTCTTLRTYIAHEGSVRDLSWSPDGKYIASASNDKTVQIWDTSSGRRLLTYSGHRDAVTAVSWSPDGTRIASASNDKTVHIWRTFVPASKASTS